MAAPLASPLFRRLAGRGAFFRGFPFRWVLQQQLHDSHRFSADPFRALAKFKVL